MSLFGVDFAWGRPGPAALKANGVKFVCRYLSHDTRGKNLTRAEAQLLSDHGFWLVVVWETTAQRALAGHSAGEADARSADAQARACGMPADRPIYFAVDWDATRAQQDAINAYLDGCASVLGRERVGMYGGFWPVMRAFEAKKIAWGWQTYAWSGGKWDARAQIQQYSNDHVINGVGCDYNRAVKDDYGQWRVGVSPAPEPLEDDVPEYVSVDLTRPQPVKAGQPARIVFDREWTDTSKAHADGRYPGILSGGDRGTQFVATINAYGCVGKWRLIETDPAKDYATSKDYPYSTGYGTVSGWCDAKQHLYVEFLPAADGAVSVAAKANYWRR